eukprot:gene10710-12456_t
MAMDEVLGVPNPSETASGFETDENKDEEILFDDLAIKTFSMEVKTTGERKFYSSSYDKFWKMYYGDIDNKHNYYEVITEDSPCHLYFDIEYIREFNPHLDGQSEMVIKSLTRHLILEVNQQLGLDHVGGPSLSQVSESSPSNKSTLFNEI